MTKVAIYVRVSSKRQDFQRQISELEALAEQRHYQVIKVITEIGSATKRKKAERPELQQLLDLARGGTIQKILVSEISRLGRRPSETLEMIDMFSDLQVSVFARNLGMETLLDNGKRNPAAAIVFTLLSEIARQETETLGERIRSGQDEARRKNKHIGRPTGTTKSNKDFLKENSKVVRLLEQGKSIRETAKLADVSAFTVQKVKALL